MRVPMQGLPPERPPARLPALLWVIAAATVVANVGGEGAFGYKASGLAWVIPLVFALGVVAAGPRRVAFPYRLWLPWVGVVWLSWYLSEYPSLQRSVQILCPVAIGCAASTLRLPEAAQWRLVRSGKTVAIALLAITGVKSGVLLTGALPFVTGLSAEAMTATVLAAFFAVWAGLGSPKALRWWALMAVVPVVAVTRTAIVAAALTLPLTLAPLRWWRRALLLAAIAAAGAALFFTPRIQGKMFKSGSGEILDVLDKDLADSGRFYMWELMREQIGDRPWLGHGAGGAEVFVRKLSAGQTGYPHNDWLLTLYDYGFAGAAVLVLTMLATGAHAALRSRAAGETHEAARLFLLAGASAFVPFALIMYTDNVMVYVSFFGNLQFTILGLGYGALRAAGGRDVSAA